MVVDDALERHRRMRCGDGSERGLWFVAGAGTMTLEGRKGAQRNDQLEQCDESFHVDSISERAQRHQECELGQALFPPSLLVRKQCRGCAEAPGIGRGRRERERTAATFCVHSWMRVSIAISLIALGMIHNSSCGLVEKGARTSGEERNGRFQVLWSATTPTRHASDLQRRHTFECFGAQWLRGSAVLKRLRGGMGPNTLTCPHCQRPVEQRVVQKAGPNKGRGFYSCPGQSFCMSSPPRRGLRFASACCLRPHRVWCYAMSGTDTAYCSIGLSACYAMSGTDLAYGATRWSRRHPLLPQVLPASYAVSGTDLAVWSYAPTVMLCAMLYIPRGMNLCTYMHAMRSPVLS
eukprot:1398209-Rhodomonas_salina.3